MKEWDELNTYLRNSGLTVECIYAAVKTHIKIESLKEKIKKIEETEKANQPDLPFGKIQ